MWESGGGGGAGNVLQEGLEGPAKSSTFEAATAPSAAGPSHRPLDSFTFVFRSQAFCRQSRHKSWLRASGGLAQVLGRVQHCPRLRGQQGVLPRA